MPAPIDFYYWPVPNGWKVAIMLEECGLPYTVHGVDILNGAQHDPAYLRLNPNNKVPTIVDPDGPDGAPLTLFESGAILLYLAEKAGRFGGAGAAGRHTVTQWLMFQMGGVGPMFGQCGYFRKYARGTEAELRHGVERYSKETHRLYGVMDRRLATTTYFAGAEYSVADMAVFPWIQPDMHGIDLSKYPNVRRWFEEVGARPAVKRAYELLADKCKLGDRSDATHASLFGAPAQSGGDAATGPGRMRLWYTPIANHVHAAEAVVAHCGLEDDVELIATSPFKVEDGRPGFATLPGVNPLLTVPALRTADGRALYGGPVIYEYLDGVRRRGEALFPAGAGAVDVRRALWLADGLFDTFVRLIIEAWEKEPRPEYVKRTWAKVQGCLDALCDDADAWLRRGAALDVAQLRAACTLDFLSARHPSPATELAARHVPGVDAGCDWRAGRARLAEWYAAARKHDCFRENLAAGAERRRKRPRM